MKFMPTVAGCLRAYKVVWNQRGSIHWQVKLFVDEVVATAFIEDLRTRGHRGSVVGASIWQAPDGSWHEVKHPKITQMAINEKVNVDVDDAVKLIKAAHEQSLQHTEGDGS